MPPRRRGDLAPMTYLTSVSIAACVAGAATSRALAGLAALGCTKPAWETSGQSMFPQPRLRFLVYVSPPVCMQRQMGLRWRCRAPSTGRQARPPWSTNVLIVGRGDASSILGLRAMPQRRSGGSATRTCFTRAVIAARVTRAETSGTLAGFAASGNAKPARPRNGLRVPLRAARRAAGRWTAAPSAGEFVASKRCRPYLLIGAARRRGAALPLTIRCTLPLGEAHRDCSLLLW